MSSARSVLWSQIAPERHLSLIDDALDQNDLAHERIAAGLKESIAEVRAEMQAGFKRCEDDSKAQRKLLVGLLLSIVASSFAIVFTVAAFGGPT